MRANKYDMNQLHEETLAWNPNQIIQRRTKKPMNQIQTNYDAIYLLFFLSVFLAQTAGKMITFFIKQHGMETQ